MHAIEDESNGPDGHVARDDVGPVPAAGGDASEGGVKDFGCRDGDLDQTAETEIGG